MRVVIPLIVALMMTTSIANAQTCTSAPTAPADVAAVRTGSNVQMTWRDPTTGGCAASRFYIEASREGVGGFDIIELDTNVTSATLVDLPSGGTWRFAVRSFNTRGVSPQASAFLQEAPTQCQLPPPPVSSVYTTVVGRQVTVNWITQNWCTQTGFRIAVATSLDGPEIFHVQVPCPGCRTFTAIAPPGVWYLRVYAEFFSNYVAPSPWAVVVVP